MKKIFYICFLATVASACSDQSSDPLAETDNQYIRLCATTGSIIGSRAVADPFTGSTPTASKPLDAQLWLTLQDGVYPHNPDPETSLPVHTSLKFTNSNMSYVSFADKRVKYPHSTTPVYCLGLYPNDEDWEYAPGDTVVSHPIDGCDDIMFAAPVSGHWDKPIDRPLKFDHSLTWLKVAACAVSFNSLDAWGKLQQISICSAASVNMNLNSVLTNGTPRFTYSNDETWIDIFDANTSYELTSTMDEIGSIFASPATEYRIRVTTEFNHVETTVKLRRIDPDTDVLTDVTDPAQTRGGCFVLSLYFHPYKVLTAECTLDKWNTETDNIYFN